LTLPLGGLVTEAEVSDEPRSVRILVEGQPWPRTLRANRETRDRLSVLDAWTRSQFRRSLVSIDSSGTRRTAYGLCGYIRVGGEQFLIIPKCFAGLEDAEDWGESVPAFLRLCQGLSSADVIFTDDATFGETNSLLAWWADFYSLKLWRALNTTPVLRYQRHVQGLPYLRGSFSWPEQLMEWGQGGHRIWSRYKNFQRDNPINQLLKWAALKLRTVSSNTRTRNRLDASLGLLADVTSDPPRRQQVNQLHVPVSLSIYREPLAIARSLYDARYPSLNPGEIPAAGLLINMPSAFEAFVDGIVREVVDRRVAAGDGWLYGSQDQSLLAASLDGGQDFFTRPDNTIQAGFDEAGKERGIVIDAKYKGTVLGSTRYEKPEGSDIYQLIASCIARGWSKGVILSPALDASTALMRRKWKIVVRESSIEVAHMRLDLRTLRHHDALERMVGALSALLTDELASQQSQGG